MNYSTKIAALASTIPVSTLFIGLTLGERVKVPEQVSASFSYMTTGLLVALISLELMPEILHEAKKNSDRAGAAIGVVTGAALLVGMVAAVDSQHPPPSLEAATEAQPETTTKALHAEGAPAEPQPKPAPEHAPREREPFPAVSVASSLIILLMYGLIIGIGLESNDHKVVKTLAMVTAGALGLDTFLVGIESASLFAERGRPVWEPILINVIGAGMLVLGAFVSGRVEGMKSRRVGSFFFFFILGVATSCSLSIVAQAQKSASEKQQKNVEWYPPIFMYFGFLVVLHAQWYSRGLRIDETSVLSHGA
jgi:zinc transporter ZupT